MGARHRVLVTLVMLGALACGAGATHQRDPATNEAASASTPPTARPTSEAHVPVDDLLGQQLPQWQVAAWSHTPPLDLTELRGKVVVVRFWTDTCPYCKASMPALQGLAEEFAGQPVVFVGLYHEKPQGRANAWQAALQIANDWGITFALGHDANWSTLRSWWLSTGERSATSSTIVLGMDGKVIHVHPGPVYFPSDDEQHAQANRDFVALRDAVVRGMGSAADR